MPDLFFDKLGNMKSFRSFLLESHFPGKFVKAVFGALPLVEATNINKAYLLIQAGSPEKLAEAKQNVNSAWAQADLDNAVKGNSRQKLLNFLYLMELRKPGFTDGETIEQIHDLAVHNSLEQRFIDKVNSDTVPEQAKAILDSEHTAAVRKVTKPYPDLTDEEERVWNRVRVYHEFPDGFRWVYAVDEQGRVAPAMPSEITRKTMNHCGNNYSAQTADDQYWELRDSTGKAYLTVILDDEGRIQESKSWGNGTNKYKMQILPYVKWLLKDQKVTGVSDRYNYGYASHKNFGVKDFMGIDPEFVDYVLENKPELIGSTESRMMFWKDALEQGLITVEQLKKIYMDGTTISEFEDMFPGLKEYGKTARFKLEPDRLDRGDSPFGANPFAVICAACGGNPFTMEELKTMIDSGKLRLEEFANYNIRLLTPEMQIMFVQSNPRNLQVLEEIAAQVSTFTICDEIWKAMVAKSDANHIDTLIKYLESANPPSKVDNEVREVFSDPNFIENVFVKILQFNSSHSDFTSVYGYQIDEPPQLFGRLCNILGAHPDIPVPQEMVDAIKVQLNRSGMETDRYDTNCPYYWIKALPPSLNRLAPSQREQVLGLFTPEVITGMVNTFVSKTDEYREVRDFLTALEKLVGSDSLPDIRPGSNNAMASLEYNTILPETKTRKRMAINSLLRTISQNSDKIMKTMKEDNSFDNDSLPCVMFDCFLRWPETMERLDWGNADTYYIVTFSMSGMLASRRNGGYINSPFANSETVKRFTDFVCSQVYANASEELLPIWSTHWGWSRYTRLGACIQALNSKFNIADETTEATFRRMCDVTLAAGDEYRILGIGSMFEIPYDEWDDMYGAYGMTFISRYVKYIPPVKWTDGDFIGNFLFTKLRELPANERIYMLEEFNPERRDDGLRTAKAVLSRLVSNGIKNGEMEVSEEEYNWMVANRFADASAIRNVLTRKADAGELSVDSYESADRVLSTFSRIMKLPSLPQLIKSTFDYLLNHVYENLGDGDTRWKVDEEAPRHAELMLTLMEKLCHNVSKGYVGAALATLYTPEIYDRVKNFEQANRAACDVPGKPKSKFRCTTNSTMEQIASYLDDYRELAEKYKDQTPKKAVRKKKTA